MGHYYECKDCGEERCRCGPPSKSHDPAFLKLVARHDLDGSWSLAIYRHTHYFEVDQLVLLVDGKRCPVDVVITILQHLTNHDFPAGIATVRGPLYRQMLEPASARQVIISIAERLGLFFGEHRRGGFHELGDFTFVGHRHGSWRDKALALIEQLRAARRIVEGK